MKAQKKEFLNSIVRLYTQITSIAETTHNNKKKLIHYNFNLFVQIGVIVLNISYIPEILTNQFSFKLF